MRAVDSREARLIGKNIVTGRLPQVNFVCGGFFIKISLAYIEKIWYNNPICEYLK